jgi:hypothetical protein
MLDTFRKLFQKSKGETTEMHLPKDERQLFVLHIGNIPVGELSCQNGNWTFVYTEQFKARSEEFYPIVGFPNLEKTYKSDTLWPFFLVRIPGLGQPQVQETIAKENLDATNEAQLLRRFGERTLANPFVLTPEST